MVIGERVDGGRFGLDREAVTDTHAVLAIRGAGKTYTASVMAEGMLVDGQQVLVIDPTGAWFGLRSSADGKKDGFPVVVFGGDNADVPLSEHSGDLIARAVVQKRFSAILDVGHFTKGEMVRFLTAFLRRLYLANRDPLHLIVDEADDVAPQRVTGEKAKLVGAIEDVVKRGRRRGIGCTLVTQRPASLNKDVLTQCATLVAMRMSHPRDIGAIREWVDVHADPKAADAMIRSLPGLPTGTAWFWAPLAGIFDQVRVRTRTTFDSSATPKVGQRREAPPRLSSIDFEALGMEIAALSEEAAANDPTKLKAEVARLRRELDSRQPVVDEAAIARAVAAAVTPYKATLRDVVRGLGPPMHALVELEKLAAKAIENGQVPMTSAAPPRPRKEPGVIIPPAPKRPRPIPAPGDLSKCERAILTGLAQYIGGKAQRELGVITGYAHTGGGFNNALSSLRTKGLIEGGRDHLVITPAGQAVSPGEVLPTGSALLEYWSARLGRCERLVLEHLVRSGPGTKAEIAAATGYEAGGGGFNNALSKLRTLELISGRDALRAAEAFFE